MPGYDYNDIADPKTWADDAKIQGLKADLRENAPVVKVAPEGYRPFWIVSKYEDVYAIEGQSEKFLAGPRTILMPIVIEEINRERFGDPNGVRSLVQMDGTDHRKHRVLTQGWFAPKNLGRLTDRVRDIARIYVDRMEAENGDCDFAADIAFWYPLRVVMSVLGVPPEDDAKILHWTQTLFGFLDEEFGDAQGSAFANAIGEFDAYFQTITDDRRVNPRDDIASLLANAEIDGEPLGKLELLSYYMIVATAGHDTTSASTAGGLQALIENPAEFAKLRANPDLLPLAVEEFIRWVAPVKHFMRTPTEDVTIRGQKIPAGDNLMLLYASACRDEEAIPDAGRFIVDREPNKHLAFGYGPHLCLGKYLAKMEIEAFYRELLPRLDQVEISGTPELMESSFVSGLKRLPIHYTMRPGAPAAAA